MRITKRKKLMLRSGLVALLVVGAIMVHSVVPLTHQQLRNKITKSTVFVGSVFGSGSGFYVKGPKTGKKYIMTAAHVCAILKGFYDIEKMDDKSDLCLIKTNDTKTPVIKLAKDDAKVGEIITAFGHPYGSPLQATSGEYAYEISYMSPFKAVKAPEECPKDSMISYSPYFAMYICAYHVNRSMTTISVYPGNSGGAVVNSRGELVGVLVIGDSRMWRGGYTNLKQIKAFLEGT